MNFLTPKNIFCLYIDGTLYGPLHSQQGVDQYFAALEEAKAQGGKIECGGKVSLLEAMLIYCQIFYLKMGCWFFFSNWAFGLTYIMTVLFAEN